MKTAARKDKVMNLDKLARMVAKGFNDVTSRMATQETVSKIDERLAIVEAKLDKALYTSLTSIEVRVKRLEQKVGIK